jgi:hypothetical protein
MKNAGIVRFVLTVVALYQIAAGCFLFHSLIGIGIVGLLFTFFFLIPYAFLQIIAGLYLLPRTIKPKYIYLTYATQAMQIIALKLFSFGYFLRCGSAIILGVSFFDSFHFNLDFVTFSTAAQIGFKFPTDGFQFMVNFIPILIIFGLSRLKKKYSVT